MIEQLFDLLAPHLCIKCKRTGAVLCASCLDSLPPSRPRCYRCHADLGRVKDKTNRTRIICRSCIRQVSLGALIGAASYESHAMLLVQRLKYERAAAAAKIMARAIAIAIASSNIPPQAVVTHAPTVAKRVRMRGYDQSALIARHLAKELGLPYRPLLRRVSHTRQVGATRQQRKEQAGQAFLARQVKMPESVILVDDVLTTGATLEAAADILAQAGAVQITAAVFAVA